MGDETQAAHLEKMVQKHPLFHTYTVSLPPLEIKRNIVKKLSKGDLILTGNEKPVFSVWKGERIVAEGKLHRCQQYLEVIDSGDMKKYTQTHQKYDILKCIVGTINSKELVTEGKIDISSLDLIKTELTINERKIAEGRLVYANMQIGIEITKVEK